MVFSFIKKAMDDAADAADALAYAFAVFTRKELKEATLIPAEELSVKEKKKEKVKAIQEKKNLKRSIEI